METLKTSYGSFNIYLNAIASDQGNFVHISFVDKRNRSHIAVMRKSFTGGWEFDDSEKYPGWILALKNQFEILIVKNEVKETQQQYSKPMYK